MTSRRPRAALARPTVLAPILALLPACYVEREGLQATVTVGVADDAPGWAVHGGALTVASADLLPCPSRVGLLDRLLPQALAHGVTLPDAEPVTLDLADPSFAGVLSPVRLPPGRYCTVELALADATLGAAAWHLDATVLADDRPLRVEGPGTLARVTLAAPVVLDRDTPRAELTVVLGRAAWLPPAVAGTDAQVAAQLALRLPSAFREVR